MQSVLSLALIIGLAGSATPLAARETFGVADAPIAGAVAAAASRLAATQPPPLSHRDWSRLHALEPGTEIIVTVRGSSASRWPFVRSDDAALWVKSFDRDRSPMPIGRGDIVEVRQAATVGHPGPGALIGLAAGSVIPIFYALNNRCGGDCAVGPGHFIVFGGLGAGLGALFGEAVHKTEEILYRAP